MPAYVARRLAQLVPVLLVSSFVIFLILHLAPGDPAVLAAGENATPDDIEAVREALGLDRPILTQYFDWLGGVFTGDLGVSFINELPVTELIFSRVGPTLELAIASILLAIVVGIPVGSLAALRPDGVFDRIATAVTAVMVAVPNFWFGILAILVLSVSLGVLPAGGYVSVFEDPAEGLRFLLLPALTLSINQMAILIRYTRASMADALDEDYIRTAVSKGIRGSAVVIRHGLRNALIPVTTMVGIMLGRLLSGAVIVESIFAWPGLGRLLVQSILSSDYVVVQGILLLMVSWFALINLAVDIAYGGIDPRIRLGERKATA